MRPRLILTIGAVLAAIFGFALLLAPDSMQTSFGLAPTPGGAVLSRDLGVVLLAVAMLDWMARDAEPGRALTAVLTGNLLVQALEIAVDSYHVATGQMAPAGIGAIVMHVLLGLGFALALWRPTPDRA
ncbi:MAG TPA: hypothetical protein VM370_01265 [Candidatus Thermoplasmatota archaeon]|nr:hypothetical protein [Candidatus Thermoplasmatota archaeon]